MTTPEKTHDTNPRPLRLAPDPDPTNTPAPQNVTDVIQALTDYGILTQTFNANPENNMLAALLSATTEQATAVLALVHDTDIEGHLAAYTVRIIRELITANKQPTPQAVLAHSRGPINTEPQPSLYRLGNFITQTITMNMPLHLWEDAAQVVEDSYRRTFSHHCTRIAQMADDRADITDLEHHSGTAVHHWRTMRQRLHHIRHLAHTERTTTTTTTQHRETTPTPHDQNDRNPEPPPTHTPPATITTQPTTPQARAS